MKRAFNFEGPVFSFLSKVADLVWINLLYVICCIPIFTIGAATTAMYYVTLKMAKDEEGYITKSFFKSFKENFKQATIIWLIYAAVIVIMICDIFVAGGGTLAVISGEGISSAILVIIGIAGLVLIMTLVYVFPILAKFENTIKNTIRNAFLISIRHLPYTFAMIIITVIPSIIIYFSARAMILVLVQFALVAYANSFLFNRIFVHYLPKEEAIEEVIEQEAV